MKSPGQTTINYLLYGSNEFQKANARKRESVEQFARVETVTICIKGGLHYKNLSWKCERCGCCTDNDSIESPMQFKHGLMYEWKVCGNCNYKGNIVITTLGTAIMPIRLLKLNKSIKAKLTN
jgi:hypothetical protein